MSLPNLHVEFKVLSHLREKLDDRNPQRGGLSDNDSTPPESVTDEVPTPPDSPIPIDTNDVFYCIDATSESRNEVTDIPPIVLEVEPQTSAGDGSGPEPSGGPSPTAIDETKQLNIDPEEAQPVASVWKWSKVVNCFICCARDRAGREKEEEQFVEVIEVSNLKQFSEEERVSVFDAQPVDSIEECYSKSAQNESTNTGQGDQSSLLSFVVLASQWKRDQLLGPGLESSPLVITNEELYFNAKKWRETEKEDFVPTLRKHASCLPSTALIVLSDGPECLNILKFHDLSVGISILELKNCTLGFMQLVEILLRCENLTQVTVSMSDDEYQFYRYQEHSLVGAPDDNVAVARYRKTIDHMVNDLQHTLGNKQPMQRMLYRISLHFPYAKACTVACEIFSAVYGNLLKLEELDISYSQQKMIQTLILMNSNSAPMEAEVLREAMALNCEEVLENSRCSLRKLSLSCKDTFPLDWLRDVNGDGDDASNELSNVIGLKYQLTCGLLYSLISQDEEHPNSVFPKLEQLSLVVPLLRLVPGWSENDETKEVHALYRDLMIGVHRFLAGHSYRLKMLELHGIRTDKIMLPWMKENLCSGPRGLTSLGVIYYSSELKQQLHEYYDEMASLAIILDKDTFDGNVNALINPNRDKKNMLFPSVCSLHIVNKLDSLQCFSISALVDKFPRLSTLVIEDYAFNKRNPQSYEHVENGSGDAGKTTFKSRAKIGNSDLKKIVQKLSGTLQILHLDCDLSEITDDGITGYTGKKNWCSVKHQKEVFSFALLTGLQYLYLRGLGDQVTDASAKLCFVDGLQFKKLRELHLFAPKITELGRKMIRDRFSSHRDFILELK